MGWSRWIWQSRGLLNPDLWLGISTFPLSSDPFLSLPLSHTHTHSYTHTYTDVHTPLCLPVWDQVSTHRSRSGTEAVNESDSDCEWTNQSMVKTRWGQVSVINSGHHEEPRNTHLFQRSRLCHHSYNLRQIHSNSRLTQKSSCESCVSGQI